MVQRKAPDKPSSHLQPKKSDKSQSSYQQHEDIGNKGGSDLKKKMKMARLISVSDLEILQGCQSKQVKKQPSPVRRSGGAPNFMKPTSSWDARKEQLQASLRPLTGADKNQRPKKTSNSNNLKLSSSATSSGYKPAKLLVRKSSLKLVRALVKKKSSGIPVFPIINASRSTCSSTMKDSKFPNALELSPGGTESKGTSVMKVCPYTYCSLNGHRHEPLPPLKCFLSARRQLLKTQKSMKLKGISLQGEKVLEKGKEEIYTAQPVFDRVPSISGVSPMIEEVGDDFFVEIYVKPLAELVNCEKGIQQADGAVDPETFIEVSLLTDVMNGTETEFEDGKGEIKSLIEESCSEISSKDNLDKNSDLSASEMDVLTTALEYVEAEPPQDTENPPCLGEDYVEWSFEECCILSVSGKISDGDTESKSNRRVFEAVEMDWEDDPTPCTDESSDCTNNGSEPCQASLPGDEETYGDLFLQASNNVTTCEEASLDAVAILEPNYKGKNLETECMTEASTVTNSQVQNQFTNNSDQNAESLESDDGCDHGCVLEVDRNYANNTDNILLSKDDMVEEPTEGSGPKSTNLGQFLLRDDTDEDVGRVFTDQAPESVDPKTRENMAASKESLEVEDALLANHIEGNIGNDESKCVKGSQEPEDDIKSDMKLEDCVYNDSTKHPSLPSEIHTCFLDAQLNHGNTDKIREKSEDNRCKAIIEIETAKSTSKVEDEIEISDMMHIGGVEEPGEDGICPVDSYKCLKEDAAIISAPSNMDQLHPGLSSDPKTRWGARRNKTDMELEELKPFNPRPPHFLPIELDPEAEKVDLKHQMMDERKKAEEWMIDQALQRAVTKLAPARREKVALLVEAFETVLPPPTDEKPLQQATMGFGHARPMQACS